MATPPGPSDINISSPTKSPTSAPVSSSPTNAPVAAPSGDYCCTWDFFHCGQDGFCNESVINCQGSCGGVWMEKQSPAMQCIQKFESCSVSENSCCPGLKCIGGN